MHEIHDEHGHVHGMGCGHVAVAHDDHVDYLHGGHSHRAHESHWDECVSQAEVGDGQQIELDCPEIGHKWVAHDASGVAADRRGDQFA